MGDDKRDGSVSDIKRAPFITHRAVDRNICMHIYGLVDIADNTAIPSNLKAYRS